MYVWSMRDKGSEWKVVRHFLKSGSLPFSPLVEAVCEPYLVREGASPKNPVDVLTNLGRKLISLTPSGRVWVDLGHLRHIFSAEDVARFYGVVRSAAGTSASAITPVVRTSYPDVIVEAVLEWSKVAHSGICIRTEGVTHLKAQAERVRDLALWAGLPDDEMDFFLDAQDLPRAASHEQVRETFPLSLSARSWVFLAGRFPQSITDMAF